MVTGAVWHTIRRERTHGMGAPSRAMHPMGAQGAGCGRSRAQPACCIVLPNLSAVRPSALRSAVLVMRQLRERRSRSWFTVFMASSRAAL
jgi:hypothetical protein